jgi:uncharacterized protein (TIGR00369 family)
MLGASILKLSQLRRQGHKNCLACTHPELKLDFTMDGPHRLRSSIDLSPEMTSFDGMVHGGIIALLLDEAMTCALLAEGRYCATGELNIRYHRPVRPDQTTHILATVSAKRGRLYEVTGELKQKQQLCVRAKARFMHASEFNDSSIESATSSD